MTIIKEKPEFCKTPVINQLRKCKKENLESPIRRANLIKKC
jgi:hypothetical protein